jgi:NTP pyrophosphatase (non-canonical NTP hydrolase)
MSYAEYEMKVLQWAEARKIVPNGTPTGQLLKLVSEVGELADAEGKKNRDKIKDGVGDIMVCLINYCALHDLDVVECMKIAYAEIKDRKGTTLPDGTFVKES